MLIGARGRSLDSRCIIMSLTVDVVGHRESSDLLLVHMSIRGNIIVLFNAYMLFGVQLL
jgi:hypothetical protein